MPKRPLGVLSLGVFIVVMAISASLLAIAILYSILENNWLELAILV